MRIINFIIISLIILLLIYVGLCALGAYAIEREERKLYRD